MKKLIQSLSQKRIIILGFGREGQSTYRFLRKHLPDQLLAIADQQTVEHLGEDIQRLMQTDKHLISHLGPQYLNSLPDYDVIIKTPGIAITTEIALAQTRGAMVTSQTKLFFSLFRERIIGVTGTKGKSTTSSLIYHILKSAGRNVILLGNIGTPAFHYIEEDTPDRWYVFELSAHQLFDLSQSPHIAVFLNIYREHLDYYHTVETYTAAKMRITHFQTPDDYLVLNADQPELHNITTQAMTYTFSQQDDTKTIFCTDETTIISQYGGENTSIISVEDIPLRGGMNRNNVMSAVLVAQIMGISVPVITSAVHTFAPLKYRLELVGTYRDIQFYDDTLATIPEATVAAVESFPANSLGTLITGGFERGQDFRILAESIVEHHISVLILLPTTGERIWKEILAIEGNHAIPEHYGASTMEEAVGLAYKYTKPGAICLLSCASPSFGLFKDYQDRSEQYRLHIVKMGTKK